MKKHTISKEWLKKHNACSDGYEWSLNKLNGKKMNAKKFILELFDGNHYPWANWVLVRLFDKTKCVQYAIFCAEQVIDIYEKKYPDDKRPRKAIEAAKEYLRTPNKKNNRAAAAADAAYAAADAATAAADSAANYAADAAATAAATAYAADVVDAAATAAYVADSAYAAYAASYAANYAANAAARKQLQKTCLEYGIKLLGDGGMGHE
jgi:hypothetical protein